MPSAQRMRIVVICPRINEQKTATSPGRRIGSHHLEHSRTDGTEDSRGSGTDKLLLWAPKY
jgi:hypothetical protein